MFERPKIGKINENIDANHFFMNDIMHCMNSNARKVTSYKYAFFKCILDNLFNVIYESDGYYHLDFKYLTFTFSKIYWNLAAKYNIPQIHNGRKSVMVEEYLKIKNNPLYDVDGVDFEVVSEEARDAYLKATSNQITKDVLYALYCDFNQHIYGYDINKKYVYFSKQSFQFLSDYKDGLEKINFYAWIKWTENILDIGQKSVSNLSRKLDEEPERIALERFKNDLLNKGDDYVCFYCGKPLTNQKVHLDHFIPWSFIKDNQPWNFVFSCAKCNESKNNRIPDKKFLNKVIQRNIKIFGKSYQENLEKSYDAALHNGFEKWLTKAMDEYVEVIKKQDK